MAAILFPSAAPMANADGILALLAEDDMRVKSIALNRLNQIVDVHWSEIATALPQIETLYEDNSFPHKELAALVASKVTTFSLSHI
jgi:26S proteasome regulatory subunit N2